MASPDFLEAKKALDQIYSEIGDYRKIVFWYDESRSFEDDIKLNSIENATIVVYDNNPIYLKHLLEVEDKDSNYLLYFPFEKPKDSDNWLLDTLLYSEVYYADQVALTMRNLELTNTDLRDVIEKHIKFFDNASRRKKLSQIIELSDNTSDRDFKYGIMSTLTKSKFNSLDYILRELMFDQDSTNYNELVKYGFENYLWKEIREYYNYVGLQKIDTLIRTFLMTTVHRNTKLTSFPKGYKAYVMDENQEDAEIFIESIKRDERYSELQKEYSEKLKISDSFIGYDINEYKSCDIFEDIDFIIIEKISKALIEGTYDFDFLKKIINDNRKTSIWWDNNQYKYLMLQASLNFYKSLDMVIQSGLTAEEYIEAYTDQYYKIDYNYRTTLTNFKLIDDDIENIILLEEKINLDYETIFLNKVSRCFNEALDKKQPNWDFNNTFVINKFYHYLEDLIGNKMFVIISDALRYEVGVELLQEINVNPVLKGNASIDYMISTIPSVTKTGMASLLPNREILLKDNKVLVDGLPSSGTEARDKILKQKSEDYAAISFSNIIDMSQKELRKYMSDKRLVYIFHDVIDKTGEKEEHKVFDSVQSSIKEIIDLIKKLYNNLQIANYVVTADHGFMYRKKSIHESEKYNDITKLKALETSKRYLITEDKIDLNYSHTFSLDYLGDNKLDVVTAYGYDSFKTQGGGINYIHGGTSLQEIIIPIIRISDLRSRTSKNKIGPVGVRLKSINRKITSRTFNLEFEQFEKVEDKKTKRNILVYFVDENGNYVSGKYPFIADSSLEDITSRISKVIFALKNIDFSRSKQYDLVLFDIDEDSEFDRIPFVIDLIGIKPLF